MAAGSSRGRPGLVLAVLSAAAFMAGLDLFIVNVAFAAIGRDLHGASLGELSWVLNGYAIVYAALLVPLGRLSDRVSRRAGFLFGLALFTVASAACAASSGVLELVTFRIMQAVGAAALTPTSLGLLLAVVPTDRRAGAVRVWAATGAIAAAAGPVVGGLLVQLSWRWVFLVNVPLGVAAVALTVWCVPDSKDEGAGPIPDLLGAGMAAVATGAVSLGLVKGTTWGWVAAPTVSCFAVAAVAAVGFWWRSARHPNPVVEPALLRVRPFTFANLTAIAFTTGFAANLLAGVLWMQQIWGYSALRTGLAVAPGPLMVPAFAIVAGRLARRRVPVGVIACIGCLLFAAGVTIILLDIGAEPAYPSRMLPGLLVGGAGVGLALPTILAAATADLPPARAATGSAVITMSRQLGSVLGVSLLIAVLGTPIGYHDTHRVFQIGWLLCAIASVIGAATALGMSPPPLTEPPAAGTTAAAVVAS